MIPCLLCPAVVVADSLCVPCGAKLWVCDARFSNRLDLINALDGNNALDRARLAASVEIANLGDAMAFDHALFVAREKTPRRRGPKESREL